MRNEYIQYDEDGIVRQKLTKIKIQNDNNEDNDKLNHDHDHNHNQFDKYLLNYEHQDDMINNNSRIPQHCDQIMSSLSKNLKYE